MTDLCDCDRRDHVDSVDGTCLNPSVVGEEPDDPTLVGRTHCGCCMADCPDVHPTPTPGFFEGGTATIAAEHVATLPAQDQARLRAREAAGEVRIRPRAEMVPDALREIKILRSARKHMRDEN